MDTILLRGLGSIKMGLSASYDAANEHMAMLEKSPERVMSYFQDPRVKYAAG